MALTERVERKIEILPDGTLQIQDATIIMRDGVEVAKTYHRKSIEPGESTSKECDRTQAVSAAVWTAEVVSEYAKKRGMEI